jgi:hypothetical protein
MAFFPKWLLSPIRLERCSGVWQFIIRVLVQLFAVKAAVAILIVSLIPDAGLADRAVLLREPFLAFFVLSRNAKTFMQPFSLYHHDRR